MSNLRRFATPILLVTGSVTNAFVSSPSTTKRTTFCFFSSAVSTLPSLLDTSGKVLSDAEISQQVGGKRIAYYFSAGWCPMCTSFEPSLMQFRQAASDSDKPIELIYVPSDRSADDVVQRIGSLQTLAVPFGEEADKLKKQFGIWAGSEALKFGFGGRRSGVPALIVLDAETGDELAFLPTESQGATSLQDWPLEDEKGLW